MSVLLTLWAIVAVWLYFGSVSLDNRPERGMKMIFTGWLVGGIVVFTGLQLG